MPQPTQNKLQSRSIFKDLWSVKWQPLPPHDLLIPISFPSSPRPPFQVPFPSCHVCNIGEEGTKRCSDRSSDYAYPQRTKLIGQENWQLILLDTRGNRWITGGCKVIIHSYFIMLQIGCRSSRLVFVVILQQPKSIWIIFSCNKARKCDKVSVGISLMLGIDCIGV